MAKRLAAVLLSAAMAVTALPASAFAVYADETEMIGIKSDAYVLMNIPFDKFYGSEGVDEPDVVTSATFKVLNTMLGAGSYHDGITYTDESSKEAEMLGVTYPVYVENIEDLEDFKEITDESSETITVAAGRTGLTTADVTGKDVLFASPSYSYYTLSEEPNRYKTMTVTDGVIEFGPVTGDVEAGGELDVTLNYSGHHTNIEFIVANEEVAGCEKVNAAILTTSDGQELALKPIYHIWRLTQLGWDYAHWDIGGKTITSAKFFLEKEGTFDVIEYSCSETIKLNTDAVLSASFSTATSVKFAGLPEDIENPLVKVQTVVGRGQTPVVIAENAAIELGEAAMSEAAVLGTQYRAIVSSDNYRDLLANFYYTGDTPAIESVSPEAEGMKIVWSPVAGVSGYAVLRDGETVAETENGVCEYLDTEAKADGTSYVYTVSSVTLDGEQKYTSPASEEVKGIYLEAPVSENLSSGIDGMNVSWNGTNAGDGFIVCRDGLEVYRTENKKSGEGGSAEYSWTDEDAAVCGTTYAYTIRAFAEEEENEYVSAASESIAAPYVGTTEVVSLANAASGTKVTWQKVSGVTGYLVYRDGKKIKSISGDSTVSFLDKGAAANGTAYSYQVLPVLRYEGALKTGACRNTMTSVYVARPTVSSVVNTASGCKVTWKKVSGAAGYYVYRNGKKVKTLSGASKVSFVDKGAKTNGTKYTYKVIAAVKKNGTLYKSAASAGKAGIYLAKGKVSKLANSKAKKMTVTWSRNSKATGYQLYIAYDGKSVKRSYAGASTVTKTLKVTKGKTYTVRVRAYRKVGSVVYYGAWSAAKKIKITK